MNFNKLFGKKDKGSKPQPQDTNGLKLYEGMLIKAESKIRKHLRVRILFITLI